MMTVMIFDEYIVSRCSFVAVCFANVASVITTFLTRTLSAHILNHFTIMCLIFIVLNHRFDIIQHRLSPFTVTIFILVLISDLTSVSRFLLGRFGLSGTVNTASNIVRHPDDLIGCVLLVIPIHLRRVIQVVDYSMLPNGLLSMPSVVRTGLTINIIVLISRIVPVLSGGFACCLDRCEILELCYPLF